MLYRCAEGASLGRLGQEGLRGFAGGNWQGRACVWGAFVVDGLTFAAQVRGGCQGGVGLGLEGKKVCGIKSEAITDTSCLST